MPRYNPEHITRMKNTIIYWLEGNTVYGSPPGVIKKVFGKLMAELNLPVLVRIGDIDAECNRGREWRHIIYEHLRNTTPEKINEYFIQFDENKNKYNPQY